MDGEHRMRLFLAENGGGTQTNKHILFLLGLMAQQTQNDFQHWQNGLLPTCRCLAKISCITIRVVFLEHRN